MRHLHLFHSASSRDIRGLKDLKQYVGAICDAFPDVHFTIDDIVAEGDMLVVRYTWAGTHKGAFMGIPPGNKKVTMWEIETVASSVARWWKSGQGLITWA